MKELEELLKSLVEIESTNPGLYEKEISKFIRGWFKKFGVETETCQLVPGRENVIATIEGESSGQMLIDINHMDVVIAGEGWESDPFKVKIEGDKLYARGALDMKAGLALGMITFRNIYQHYQSTNSKPKKAYRFIASVDEEGEDMGGVEVLIKNGFIPKGSFVIDHEPTDERLATAHKGKIFFKLKQSRLEYLMECIYNINEFVDQIKELEGFGKSTVCFGILSQDDNGYFVTMDIRLTPLLSIEMTKDFMKALCKSEGSFEVLLERPAIPYHQDKTLLMELLTDEMKNRGKASEEVLFTGYTDTAVIAQKVEGVNILSFGPRGYGLHQPNEWVSLSSISEVAEICETIYLKWLEVEEEQKILKITFYGKRAHGSTPWQGIDSIIIMSQYLKCLKENYPEINLIQCYGGDSINVMAENCCVEFSVAKGLDEIKDFTLNFLGKIKEEKPGFYYDFEGF